MSPEPLATPLVLAMVAPKDCGKTVWLAALLQLAQRGGTSLGAHRYHIRDLVGFGHTAMSADAASQHLRQVYASLTLGEASEVTNNVNSYRALLERQGRRAARREVYLLDVQGGHLFPGLEDCRRTAAGVDEGRRRSTLRQRLDELGLADAEVALLVFVNEPAPGEGGWRMHPHVPAQLARYLEDIPLQRVALHVACADVLFPRLGDLRQALGRLNARAEKRTGLAAYLDYFRGGPHAAFTLDLLEHLASTPEAAEAGTRLGVFWSSSFGALRAGQPNVLLGRNPAVLADPVDWTPLHVLEPLLWAAGLWARDDLEVSHADP